MDAFESVEKFYTKDLVKQPHNTTVETVVKIMSEKNIGAVLVTDDTKKVCGIFTERDLLNKVVAKGKKPSETALVSVMTSNILTVPLDTKPTVAMEMMLRKKFRHLPVTDQSGHVIGMVSLRSVLGHIIKNLATLNRSMQEELDELRFINLIKDDEEG